jgi:hypothetical protein
MAVGYGLTLWRVQWDRSGRQLFTLTDRIQEEFERWLSQYTILTRPFSSHNAPIAGSISKLGHVCFRWFACSFSWNHLAHCLR